MEGSDFKKESVEKVSINWTIPDFSLVQTSTSFGSFVSSHEVSSGDLGIKWTLRLYPNGRSNPQFIDFSILCNGLTEDDEFFATSSGSFKSACEMNPELNFKIPSELSSRTSTIDERSRGWSTNKFLSMNDLIAKQILINGQLTLTCDIYFIPKTSPCLKRQLVTPIDYQLFRDFLNTTTYTKSNYQSYPSLFHQFTDFKIVCFDDGNKVQKIIPCHRVILMKSSTIFEAMFNHKSLTESTTNTITIEDFPYETIKAMVGFIYYGLIGRKKSLDEVVSLLLIADKYNLVDLKLEAAKILFQDHVVEESLITCLSVSVSSNCPFLTSILSRLVRINWKLIVSKVDVDELKKICPNFELNPPSIQLNTDEPSSIPRPVSRRERIDSTGCQETTFDSNSI